MKYNELTEDLTNFKGYCIVSILYMSEIRKLKLKVTFCDEERNYKNKMSKLIVSNLLVASRRFERLLQQSKCCMLTVT